MGNADATGNHVQDNSNVDGIGGCENKEAQYERKPFIPLPLCGLRPRHGCTCVLCNQSVLFYNC